MGFYTKTFYKKYYKYTFEILSISKPVSRSHMLSIYSNFRKCKGITMAYKAFMYLK